MKKWDIVTIIEFILTIVLTLIGVIMLPLIGLVFIPIGLITIFLIIAQNS